MKTILFLFLFPGYLYAQPFAPPAGHAGTTAVPADSKYFISWADSCLLSRGPAIITFPDSLAVTHGEPADATGQAGDGKVVSLGDGGSATLYFNDPVLNGPGPDFAVFENGLNDTFLELAFVEVSSDGNNFFRFDAVSMTPADVQVDTYGSLDATNIHNLAGKYRAGYGTPFDLEELGSPAGLDMTEIHWIRIIDVIGIIDEELGNKDANGNMINDPWPTPFITGGFDLDATGVLTGLTGSVDHLAAGRSYRICNSLFDAFLDVDASLSGTYRIIDMHGRIMLEGTVDEGYNVIDTRHLITGLYIFVIKGHLPSRIIKTNQGY